MSSVMKFTKIALGNLFSKPATTQYPFVKKDYPERYRGKVTINIDDCIMCGMCERKCPSSAIKVDRNTRTWSINRMSCVQCANCANNCPKKCLTMEPQYSEPENIKTIDSYVQPVKETAKPAGKPKSDLSVCVFCTLCAKKCPQEAITVDRAEKKWELDSSKCVSCGLCASNCPKKCITME